MKHDVTLSRRELLALGGALGLSASLPGALRPALALTPDPSERRYDAVIQVFLAGAPSQLDTLDPKPGSTSNLFPTIDLGVRDADRNAVRVTTFLRQLAGLVGGGTGAVRLATLRSVHHATGVHSVAQGMMASFWQSPVAAAYPPVPVVLGQYLRSTPGALGIPTVVLDGQWTGANDAKGTRLAAALEVVPEADPAAAMRLPVGVSVARATRRRDLLGLVSSAFSGSRPDATVAAWDAATAKAHDVAVKGAAAKAFELRGKQLVPAGSAALSRRLTMARELVVAGVPYVALGSGGHDLHTGLAAGLKSTWGDQLDVGLTALCRDLAASGKRVLIAFGGEFGRTPESVKPDAAGDRRDGRDHHPHAFSWGLLSINQPDFVSTAIGDTGPDGLWETGTLVDPIAPSALGGLLYRVLGFPLGDPTKIRLADGRLVQPVDAFHAGQDFESPSRITPITTPRLLRRLFTSVT